MPRCNLNEFKTLVLELNNILRGKDVDSTEVNKRLDQLNALEFRVSASEEKSLEEIIITCCTDIPAHNTLLVAKGCNLIFNHIIRNKIILSNASLVSVLNWAKEAINKSSDLAFLDILQIVNALIKAHPSFFNEQGCNLVPFLLEKLENKTNLLQPNDVKLWRVFCLQSLAKAMFKEDRAIVVSELLSILYSQSNENLLVHSKIWRTVIETFDCLVLKGNTKWLSNKLADILGVMEVAASLGLSGKEPLLPKQIFPSSVFTPDLPDADFSTRNTVYQPGKKKQKSKTKRVCWSETEEEADVKANDPYQLQSLTSDSDYSDSESGQVAKLTKEQAKTRLAAYNFVIRLTNVLKGKLLYGYYNMLITTLIYCIKNESTSKPKIGAFAAVGALLNHSKPFLAQAQHCEGTSFLAFSGSLSELVNSLHNTLCGCLTSAPPLSILPSLLNTTASLIAVSPYHRLRPALLFSLFTALQPFLNHKDATVCTGSLKCLNEIVSLETQTNEQKEILRRGIKCDGFSFPTILSFLIFLIKANDTNETVRLTCWQVVGNMCKHHIGFVEDSLTSIEQLLLVDLKSQNTDIQLYATYALNKMLEAIIDKDNLKEYNKELWLKLLEGPLINLLQSPEAIACEACDCLANMGPIIFSGLKEKEQILVVTLIFGCINHEKGKVRAAAVHTLGIFLLFPQMSEEQFLYDAKDLLISSLSDSFLLVRIKAAWAMGNLVDLVVNNQDSEFLQSFSLKGLLAAAINVTNDDELVKSNIVRAMGYMLLALKEEELKDTEVQVLLDKAVQFLLKCTMSGTKMKMRWNACYAIGTMLKNSDLFAHSDKWMTGLIQNLCKLIVSCSNFKVRAGACAALCHIPARAYFGSLYCFVWTSLLDGLDNSANMPDFREYKHQDSLKQQLCSTLCHIATLITCEDLGDVEQAMDFRLDNLMDHILYFQENTVPEQTAGLVSAANHLQELMLNTKAVAHLRFLNSLKTVFGLMHVS